MNGPIDGVLLVDKPPGIGSFGVVRLIRRWFGLRKVGHTGSLDPFATGLLVLCLGKATRLARYITQWDKGYEGVIKLGEEMDTDDPTGRVISTADPSGITIERVKEVLQGFRGEIWQVPPRFSAKKMGGVPSYRLARRGDEVVLPAVRVKIYQLDIVSLEIPLLRFIAFCSKGTYMRALARDVGRALGCGAHLLELRRTAVGWLKVEDAVGLDEIKGMDAVGRKSLLLSPKEALSGWKEVRVNEQGALLIRHGRDLNLVGGLDESLEDGQCVKLVDEEGRFLGVGRTKILPSGLVVHPERMW